MSCRYVKRKTREDFRANGEVTQDLWSKAQQQLELVKRQAVVYSMYARDIPNVMVCGMGGTLWCFVTAVTCTVHMLPIRKCDRPSSSFDQRCWSWYALNQHAKHT